MHYGGILRLRHSVLIGLVSGLLVAAGISVAPVAPSPASAASGSDFKAGYIIDDSKFFAKDVMSVAEIQAFLNAKVPRCAPGATCLKSYTESTRTLPTTPMCTRYDGAPNETAATIIWKVQQTCGISAKVLLVTLQKEQGLVTNTAPSAGMYRSAMGAGCPDTAACDSNYYGFFNQVHYGAFLFKRYTQPPGTGGDDYPTRFDLRYPVGKTTTVLYGPSPCVNGPSSAPVFISNQATHVLYVYTPYQPNPAALANLYGTGDACSSYGNRNFFAFYTDWFGPTTGADQPVGNIESATATSTGVQVTGWTLDPNSPDPISIRVSVDGAQVATATADGARPDVQAVFPGTGPKHGFSVTVPTDEGTRSVCVSAVNVGPGADSLIGCRNVEVHYALPFGVVEGWTPDDVGAKFSGWAMDPNTSGPVLLHVYADGALVDGYLADRPRADVAVAYPGTGSAHGYSIEVPLSVGTHQVCIYAINVGAGSSNPALGCPTVVVPSRAPRGFLDSVGTYSQGVTLSGWALDPGSTVSVWTHVYIDGAFAGGLVAGDSRPDVGAAFPRTGDKHGFSGRIATGDGAHSVCAYALNEQVDKNLPLGCRTVTVQRPAPSGRVDRITASAGYATMSGWSFDPGSPQSTNFVHIYADGKFIVGYAASDDRPDVGAAYPAAGAAHGWSGTFWIGGGVHTVCAYGLSSIGGPSAQLGCVAIRGA